MFNILCRDRLVIAWYIIPVINLINTNYCAVRSNMKTYVLIAFYANDDDICMHINVKGIAIFSILLYYYHLLINIYYLPDIRAHDEARRFAVNTTSMLVLMLLTSRRKPVAPKRTAPTVFLRPRWNKECEATTREKHISWLLRQWSGGRKLLIFIIKNGF